MAKYDESDGVWRTIGGRKVFIKNGQDLASAMIESGKFKKGGMRATYRKAKQEDDEINKKRAQEQEKGFAKQAEKELRDIRKEPNEKVIKEELKDIEREKEQKDLRGKGLTDDEIDKGYKDVNEAIKDKANSEYEEYKKMRLDDPSKYTNEDIKKFNELDKKYLDRFNKEETQIIRYRDGYAVKQNGGIQKTFDNVDDAKKFESELKSQTDKVWEKQEDGSYKANKEEMKKAYEERHKKYDAKIKQLAEDRENMPNSDWEASVMTYEKQNADGTYRTFDDISKDVENYQKMEVAKEIAKEINPSLKNASEERLNKEAESYLTFSEGTVTSDYKDWELNEDKTGPSLASLQNRLTYLQKGYDETLKQGNQITQSLRQKAYNKYLKEHPGSKMSFEDFLKKQ